MKTSSEFAPRYVTPAGRGPRTVSIKRGRKSGDLNDGRSLGGARRPGAGGLPLWVPHLQRARAPLRESEGDCPQHSVLPRTALAAALPETVPVSPSQPGTYTFSFLLTPWSTCKGIYPCIICLSIHLSIHAYLSITYLWTYPSICVSITYPSIHPYLSGCLPTYWYIFMSGYYSSVLS